MKGDLAMLVVQKYGGSSVADIERIRAVASRVAATYDDGNSVVVVVSAMGDTTDGLIDMVSKLTDLPSERELDVLLSTGEQISIALLSMALQALDKPAISLTGAQAGIKTDNVHTKARINEIENSRLRRELKQGKIVVVAGFQGVDENNDFTTLGRGGSDTSAVALAVALNADLCEIYTDVDGVYTTDPRVVLEAQKLDVVSYDEMLELASLGAAVLHPRSVELAKKYSIPLHVRSSFNEHEGTNIQEADGIETALAVNGIAYDMNVAKLGICYFNNKPEIVFKLFKAFADAKLNVDMITQSSTPEHLNNILFTCAKNDVGKAKEIITKMLPELRAASFSCDDSVAKLSIVGAGIVSNPSVAARMFEGLVEEGINIEMISTSEIKISCIVKANYIKRAVAALHKKFCLDQAVL